MKLEKVEIESVEGLPSWLRAIILFSHYGKKWYSTVEYSAELHTLDWIIEYAKKETRILVKNRRKK